MLMILTASIDLLGLRLGLVPFYMYVDPHSRLVSSSDTLRPITQNDKYS